MHGVSFLPIGKLRLAEIAGLVIVLSACVDAKYYQHNVGLMAPQPHPSAVPVRICEFSVLVTDPEFNAQSHQYIDAELRSQLLKYIHYDGRLAISDQRSKTAFDSSKDDCQWQQLQINFTQLTDMANWKLAAVAEELTTDIATAAEITLVSAKGNKTFYHQERMLLAMDDSWNVDRLLSVNSVRNRTNFIDAVIAQIVSEVNAL